MSEPSRGFRLRRLRPDEWDEVAALIFESTNAWYRRNLNRVIFPGDDPAVARVFPEIYEALDPGCCLVAEDTGSGRLIGSCFVHPRETHVALGIMNAHPDAAGRGVARAILAEILRIARDEEGGKPVRLVSSAMNLDSFSLYTRAGFVPVRAFQDIFVEVPEDGMRPSAAPPGVARTRPAVPDDAPAMADLEFELNGIRREKDYRFFIENAANCWSVSVIPSPDGARLDGFLCSIAHPASRMLGPGVAQDEAAAAALVFAQLDRHHRGASPVFLLPVDATDLVRTVYGWGGRNCEIHFSQVFGNNPPQHGITFPTFMPETG